MIMTTRLKKQKKKKKKKKKKKIRAEILLFCNSRM